MIQAVAIVVAVLGSLVFQLQPGSSELLYFHGSSWSCTTRQEWTWIAATGVLMLLLHAKPTERFNTPSEQAKSKLLLWFLVLNFVWFVAALSEIQFSFSPVRMLVFLGGKSAWPGLWNLAFIVFPVKRSSEILALSHKDTLFLHVWAGHAVFFWLAVHTVFLSIAYAVNYDYSVHKWMKVMVPSGNLYTEGVVNFMGWLGFAMLLALWLTSLPWIRKHFYESFAFLHLVTAALFILFSNLHDYNTIHFVQPAFAAWIAERLVRRISTLKVSVDPMRQARTSNGDWLAVSVCKSSVTDQFPRLVSLTMSLPQSWSSFHGAGMFLYLKCPSISSWQLHPFSISAIDTVNMTFSVHIKALGDWTNHFVQQMNNHIIQPDSSLDSQQTSLVEMNDVQATDNQSQFDMAKFDLYIEGPYYSDLGPPLDSDQNCLFVAGGVGLTGLSEALYRRHARGQPIRLVWMIRTREEMEFLAKDLLYRLHPPRTTTRIMVFITRQNKHENQNKARPSVVDHLPLLQSRSRLLVDGVEEASGSTKTFPVTVQELCMYPSMRTMAFVSFLGVALSFLLARMVCCNRSVRDLESGKILHTCSVASTSTTCSNSCEAEENGATCCTTPICYYCFRGVPVIFMFLVAPILPVLFAWMYPRCYHVMKWLLIQACHGTQRASSRLGDYEIQHQVPIRIERVLGDDFSNPDICGNDTVLSSHQRLPAKDNSSDYYRQAAIANLNHMTIEHKKPVLSEVIEDFCASGTKGSESHDLELTSNISEVESEAITTAATEEAAVFVCGSEALAGSLLHEVKRHNDGERIREPTSGTLGHNRHVHLSVWTATGAY